jgi:hypothetical protein
MRRQEYVPTVLQRAQTHPYFQYFMAEVLSFAIECNPSRILGKEMLPPKNKVKYVRVDSQGWVG